MEPEQYDLIVIGSGPAGQKGAICAAKLRKRVAIIDRLDMIGGVCVHTGTVPSKTVREAALYLTGFTQRAFYGRDYSLKDHISVEDLGFRVRNVIAKEQGVVRAQLKRNDIDILDGHARFADPHTLEVTDHKASYLVRGEHILIACGTRPARDPSIAFDGKKILDTDQLVTAGAMSREAIVVGAGVVGLEYASILAALGTEVTLIDQRPTLLGFVDRQIIEALTYHLRNLGTIFRLGEKVVAMGVDEARNGVFANLDSGKMVRGNVLVYAVGRQPNTDTLNLEAAGITPGERGKLIVNENFQTRVPHIYAAGDIIGFPALASTSMEQGRLASCHMFGLETNHDEQFIPYGIYTIPEISMVGRTEEELTASKTPYEVGISRFDELVKSQMLGDQTGMLKLLFDPKSLKVLGVHVIGARATEIVHIGQAVFALGATIEYFRDTVFNYPTLAEAYKVAALDGLNKL